jgi:hypothetical protein
MNKSSKLSQKRAKAKLYITGCFGARYKLSEEVYIWSPTVDDYTYINIRSGQVVRLISGVDDSDIPGYHFDDRWVTVCPVGAKTAKFIGVQKADLIKG